MSDVDYRKVLADLRDRRAKIDAAIAKWTMMYRVIVLVLLLVIAAGVVLMATTLELAECDCEVCDVD